MIEYYVTIYYVCNIIIHQYENFCHAVNSIDKIPHGIFINTDVEKTSDSHLFSYFKFDLYSIHMILLNYKLIKMYIQ